MFLISNVAWELIILFKIIRIEPTYNFFETRFIKIFPKNNILTHSFMFIIIKQMWSIIVNNSWKFDFIHQPLIKFVGRLSSSQPLVVSSPSIISRPNDQLMSNERLNNVVPTLAAPDSRRNNSLCSRTRFEWFYARPIGVKTL